MNNNYTTTEQSDRLINAGVPASSADCYFYTKADKQPKILTTDKFDWLESPYIPCWSVGRLFEIIAICLPAEIVISTDEYPYVLDNILQVIEDCIEEFDFSKLEEQ